MKTLNAVRYYCKSISSIMIFTLSIFVAGAFSSCTNDEEDELIEGVQRSTVDDKNTAIDKEANQVNSANYRNQNFQSNNK